MDTTFHRLAFEGKDKLKDQEEKRIMNYVESINIDAVKKNKQHNNGYFFCQNKNLSTKILVPINNNGAKSETEIEEVPEKTTKI